MNNSFKVISPIDLTIYLERAYAGPKQIENVLSAAANAQKEWQKKSITDRALLCQKAVDLLVARADQIGEEITMQMGRPIRYTPNEIRSGLKERAEYMIHIAESALSPIDIDSKRKIKREPMGTVMVLAPWNYPYLTSINAIIPALMAGNTVILKHSDQTPLTSERYQEAFDEVGLPEGVFQFLHLNHDQVAQVIQDFRINHVAFTGSVEGGHAIQKALSGKFITSGLELGGKDAAYVTADADVQKSVENLVDGAFFNSGQSCCGIERIYVHESIYESFVQSYVSLTKKYVMGNPLLSETEIGPMVKPAAARYVMDEIDKAVDQGAQKQIKQDHLHSNAYLYPEVLTKVNHSMSIMTKETFGPVVGIMSVHSDEEAIRLVNDSPYGLTASIWSQDKALAWHIGDQLEVGTVFMNRCDYLDPELAWTGVKKSGKGCTLSSIGYEQLTRPKSFHFRTL
ncbi:aldehyde dehydrogenase family protein [Portibacter marinus]|uniref:aldehyde dehydrogenase family protein n=1 Tax=Portibacter marinus TaxID=2898660 RepID=UPI001F3A6819|nr:aldehyde dehydrogenase family protein [Portibacter marinus]